VVNVGGRAWHEADRDQLAAGDQGPATEARRAGERAVEVAGTRWGGLGRHGAMFGLDASTRIGDLP
jgi:hypothetical protein